MNREQYEAYQERVEHFHEKENHPIMGDTISVDEFSHISCDCCGDSLGGTRHILSGRPFKSEETYEYTLCVDCIYYLEHGKLDDMTMEGIEKKETHYAY